MDAKKCRLLYMGTPFMSSRLLEHLILENWNVIGVVTNPDRPKGRKGILTPSPVKEIANKYNIPCYQPTKIRKDYLWAKDLEIDCILTFAYGQIVPEEFLSFAQFGAYNVHGSLLPKYRGAAPIQRAIMNGDKVLGATLMRMVKAMDAGEMFGKVTFSLGEEENCEDAFYKMGNAAISLVDEYLPKVLNAASNKENIGIQQKEDEVTFASKISADDEHLPLDISCKEAKNYIRALSPEPSAYVLFRGEKLKIISADLAELPIQKENGSLFIFKKDLYLQLKDGALLIKIVQPAGKKQMDGRSFANGARLDIGELLQ